MSKRREKKESRISLKRKTQRLIVAIILFTLAIILFLGLVNLAGVAGEFLVLGLEIFFGWTSWLIPIVLVLAGWLVLKYENIKEINQASDKRYPSLAARCGGLVLLVIILSAIFHIHFIDNKLALIQHQGGGYFGYALSYLIVKTFGVWASWVIFIGLFVIGLIIVLAGLINFRKPQGKEQDENKEIVLQSLFKSTLGRFKTIFKRKQKLVLKPKATDTLLAESIESIEEYKDDDEGEIIPQIKNISAKSRQKIDLPLSLLGTDSTKPNAGDIKENKLIIKKTLENFNISVEMGEVKVGPTVTQYTLKPADGVKLSNIIALHNDLALALATHPIRIEAPIPGQSLVGLEIPNQQVAVIRLRNILSDNVFKNRKSKLTIALGRDVAGNVWLADLGKMPHCLVAGSTGSGKTIFLNSIIISLIYQNSPDDLRFILVDPKRVELTFYNDLPHLLTPVITNTQKTINALKWAVGEMDRRFDVMAEAKKRDIYAYNQANPDNKMPFIVIIIDELADLMTTSAQEVEACIIRLAQMARAIGIHLIMATQRPSVDIITGLIKANITSRIAFSVASLMDSRTILDFSGAEKLLGRGDMLFISSELSKPKRIQGAYVSDDEVKRIVDYLRNVSEPNFQEDITETQQIEKESEYGELKQDEMLPEARDVIIQSGKASASFLQRRLRIGYARAARILDLLEEEGTIGPADGAKPREIYKSSSDEKDL